MTTKILFFCSIQSTERVLKATFFDVLNSFHVCLQNSYPFWNILMFYQTLDILTVPIVWTQVYTMYFLLIFNLDFLSIHIRPPIFVLASRDEMTLGLRKVYGTTWWYKLQSHLNKCQSFFLISFPSCLPDRKRTKYQQ